MKYVIIVMIVLGALLGGYALNTKTTDYVAPVEPQVVVQEKEVVKEVNPIEEQIATREAELTEKYEKIKKLEARIDVLKSERTRMDAEIKSLQAELAGFIQETE